MEELLHYVWQNKLFPLTRLHTTDGRRVEVLGTGIHNADAGADFLGARVVIDGQSWAGNVEIHERASDWQRHGHDSDAAYNSVILHVVGEADTTAVTQAGSRLPQVVLEVPPHVLTNFTALLREERLPACHRLLPSLSPLELHAYLSRLAVERLEMKTQRIGHYLFLTANDWERTFFIALARNMGFGINGDAFEEWALRLRPSDLAKHRDNPALIEAYFLGTAGLLAEERTPGECRDDYYRSLCRDFAFLRHKFGCEPLPAHRWKYLRLRPQNFPHLRLAQLADLYCRARCTFASLTEARTIDEVLALLVCAPSPYWQTHFTFGHPVASVTTKTLQIASRRRIAINTVVPLLFAYGSRHDKEALCQRAFDFLESLPAEDDRIVRHWQASGIVPQSAADSQALNHLKTSRCDARRCLACDIGRKYVSIDTF